MEFLTRAFPGGTDFLDLKDPFGSRFDEACSASGAEFSGFAGSRAAGRFAEHDAARAGVEHLCERRREAARGDFAPDVSGGDIEAITNGVHAGTWTSAPFQQLFDRYIPSWREDTTPCGAR